MDLLDWLLALVVIDLTAFVLGVYFALSGRA
jgi:hypothetical protein